MTDQQPESADALDVTMEASVTDGVFRIDAGVENLAIVTMHYSEAATELLPQLLAVMADQWPAAHERIVEVLERAIEAEQAKADEQPEQPKHRLEETSPATPAIASLIEQVEAKREPEPEVEDIDTEEISSEPTPVETIHGDGIVSL